MSRSVDPTQCERHHIESYYKEIDVRSQAERGTVLSISSQNAYVAALDSFLSFCYAFKLRTEPKPFTYKTTFCHWVGKEMKVNDDYQRKDKNLPAVPSLEIVRAFIKRSSTAFRDYCMLCTLWATGVRSEELLTQFTITSLTKSCGASLGSTGVPTQSSASQLAELLLRASIKGSSFKMRIIGKRLGARNIIIDAVLAKELSLYLEIRPKCSTDSLWVDTKGRPITTTRAIRLMMQRASRRAGIRLHPHLLRHAFAIQHLAEKMSPGGSKHPDEADLMELQSLLGHKSIETTQIYLRHFADAKREVQAEHTARIMGKSQA